MTTPGDRFKGWIDGLAVAWSERLGKWSTAFVMGGIEGILDKMGVKASVQLKPLIDALEKAGPIPPELKPIIDEIKNPTGETAYGFGLGIFNRVVGSIKGDIFEYLTRSITRGFSYSADFYLPDARMLLSYYFQNKELGETFYNKMRSHGIPPEEADRLIDATRLRFPSDIAIPLWLRDPNKYAKFLTDVRELGVDAEHLEALKELAYKLPSPQEAIVWLAREVFEPEMVKKYGLDDEFAGLDLTIMNQIGIKPEIAKNHWRAHWQHASWSQMVAMLHRGVLRGDGTLEVPPASARERAIADTNGEMTIFDWFRLVEIPPYWRKGLTATMWNVPGRVEARMLAQYGLVDKPFLVELLARDGLAEEYRDVVADMMLVRGIRTDIQTRYVKKWLTSEEVRAEIASHNLSPAVADRLYQWIVSNAKTERTAPEKDLTAAEIIKGVKRGVIAWSEGIERLEVLGYDEEEAVFKMTIDIEVKDEEPTSELNVRVDTLRRRRRQRLITRDEEITGFLTLRLDPGLAQAYADNDDLRLVKERTETT